ncbi:peptidase inhibitor family I36 protein [Streptomyces microflavus]
MIIFSCEASVSRFWEGTHLSLKTKIATGASVLALAVSGLAATAAPASAVGGCPSGKLCFYSGANYSGLYWTSASTAACVSRIQADGGPPRSYVNNLPVQVKIWGPNPGTSQYIHYSTIRAGGFSSNTGSVYTEGWSYACTGGVEPS